MKVRIELEPEAPERYRRVLAAIPQVQLQQGSRNRIGVDRQLRPLTLFPRPQPGADQASVASLAQRVTHDGVGMVVASTIPERERKLLEAMGLSWCDGRGAIHIAWPGTLIHIESHARRARATSTGTEKLGPVGLRAVQVLLASPDDAWTVSRLAREASASTGQAHTVFKALEAERLIVTTGKGPNQRRHVADHRAALDWLAGLDLARRRPESAAAYLYARTPEQLLSRFAERATQAGVQYAATAAAGCQLLGFPVLNQLIVAQIRVSVLTASQTLERMGLECLDAEEAGRGINLELWTDTGELGTYGAREMNGVRVAPPIRVWLDLARQRGRSADAAQLFREQVLERA